MYSYPPLYSQIMKRIFFILAITMATVFNLQAGKVDETSARQVADNFFKGRPSRMLAPSGQSATRLAYTAEQERFYVFDRGARGGFVVVAGDDRLPQVLGYGDVDEFSVDNMPPSMKYWMDEMSRQIEYLQSHGNVPAHHPKQRAAAVAPLLTTQWNQDAPYNNYCPTYSDGIRSVTGCVATAMAQVMNYHEWPAVGRGSHSYHCNVNETTPTDLSADFSQSVYRWDLMLDSYDSSSSPESCDAVARLMSDVGISIDMDYGSSSGASEAVALASLKRYFDYNDKGYLLMRDFYSAEEWDQFLVDELSARRPILYCGFSNSGGHAFVFDGFDNDGYYHVNWGWGGAYDGYFLVSVLAPASDSDFKYSQDGMFGVVPSPQADEVPEVLFVRSRLVPATVSAPLGQTVRVKVDDFVVQGNRATGYNDYDDVKHYYVELSMSLGIFDSNNVERHHVGFTEHSPLSTSWSSSGRSIDIDLPTSLEDGEYKIKLHYALEDDLNDVQEVFRLGGQELYVKMVVRNGIAYLSDSFLSDLYSVDSYDMPSNIKINQLIDVNTKLSYPTWWAQQGPVGNVYLAFLKDGDQEVTTSEMYEVQLYSNSSETYQMQIKAPAEWGKYDLALKDEYGNVMMMTPDDWSWDIIEARKFIFVYPPCQELVEDFETMTANSSTSDKNVQGRFTTWSFTKSGVRAPGDQRCNDTNSVMMKKPSAFYTTLPLNQNFFMVQATFFNPAASAAKYTMDYSVDGGATWHPASTLEGANVVEVPEKSQVTARCLLNLSVSQPATFRIAMVAGGSASTYVDDFALYYIDTLGDVNGDGETNIADINTVINMILDGNVMGLGADVNSDGEINIADVNALLEIILK